MFGKQLDEKSQVKQIQKTNRYNTAAGTGPFILVNSRHLLLILALSLFVNYPLTASFSKQPTVLDLSKPNIIVILLDDLGYSDIGAYGGEINTPHMDRLAANGLRFTQNYNAARCCPSRAGADRHP